MVAKARSLTIRDNSNNNLYLTLLTLGRREILRRATFFVEEESFKHLNTTTSDPTPP